MKIPLQNIRHIYDQILQAAHECDGLGCSIYIFVSNDTDSIASLKILTVSFLHIINLTSNLLYRPS